MAGIERPKDEPERPPERERVLALAVLTPGSAVLNALVQAQLRLLATKRDIEEALERGYVELCAPTPRKVPIDGPLREELQRWRDLVAKWAGGISEIVSAVKEWRAELDRRRELAKAAAAGER